MRVKKYFVSKYQERKEKREKRKKHLKHLQVSLYSLFCLLKSKPNCNAGISFHGVVQNIFTE